MFKSDINHENKPLKTKLEALYALNTGDNRVELGFRAEYLSLLEKFGNPHQKLPPTIHVAGTNGKGSTIAILRAILQAQGLRVHAYTSPHLVRFNERIIINNQEISDKSLEALIDEASHYNGDNPVTFFEVTTAIAFAAFARAPADILLLETGLGGRLDCTNVIESPLATIITAIGLDHQNFLGNSVEAIAKEKAGIMKKDAPCIIAAQSHPQALKTLQNYAQERDIQCYSSGAQWSAAPPADPNNDTLRFTFQNGQFCYQRPALQGMHQIDNAGAALAALKVIAPKIPVSDSAINQGLQKAHWPARLQKITPKSAPPNWEIYLDGGHNADAAAALIQQIKDWQSRDDKPLHIIAAMMRHKQAAPFLQALAPYAQSINYVPITGEADAYTPEELQAITPYANTAANWQDALKTITQNPPAGRVLICGSLYLAGHILQSAGLQA